MYESPAHRITAERPHARGLFRRLVFAICLALTISLISAGAGAATGNAAGVSPQDQPFPETHIARVTWGEHTTRSVLPAGYQCKTPVYMHVDANITHSGDNYMYVKTIQLKLLPESHLGDVLVLYLRLIDSKNRVIKFHHDTQDIGRGGVVTWTLNRYVRSDQKDSRVHHIDLYFQLGYTMFSLCENYHANYRSNKP